MITGTTGFVGQNLVPYLKKRNFPIFPVGRNINNNHEKKYNDLRVKDFNQNDVFIHLAGKAHDLKNVSNDEEYFKINTDLTKRLFDQFLKSNCKTFIYISSVKAAADFVNNILTEETEPKPITAYGKSKLQAEKYILKKNTDKQVIVLRPCMIHGRNNKGNLNLLYSFISKGIPFPLGKYKNVRSFVSIENLCFVILELIKQKNVPSGVYNVSDDESLSTNELVRLIGEVINRPVKVIEIPKLLIKFIANVGNRLPLPINSERLEKLTQNYKVSNLKIKKALLITSLPISAREGFKKTIESFMQ